MSLRIRHIRLRALTTGGVYGADVPLSGGLTVLHAPNTSGKSTVLQGFLYALGMEQMLSPRREIPLPYAMREYVEDPRTGERHSVVESYVAVEIENALGEQLTVRRGVAAVSDKRLVSVTEGPELSRGPAGYAQRDYFVHDPGSAQREAGFHRRLADFLGWQLPIVKRYDGADCPLYVETIFPLFFVEQKVGWTAIPGAIPTQFRIREVHRRSVEFLLRLDTHETELRRQEIDAEANRIRIEWVKLVDTAKAWAAASGLRVARLPDVPTAFVGEVRASFLEMQVSGQWRGISAQIGDLSAELEELTTQGIPEVEDIADVATAEAEALSAEIQRLNSDRAEVFRTRQAELVQQAATQQRIAQLDEDLKRNRDALKLQQFGSTLSSRFGPDHCPTCEQPIHDVLLPQGTLDAVMSIEDNIEYIGAQLRTFKRLVDRSVAEIGELDLELIVTGADLRSLSTRLRALKADLVAPSYAMSASAIEERLRIEQRIDRLREAEARFADQVDSLAKFADNWSEMLVEKSRLPAERLSGEDLAKVQALEDSIRAQLVRYGFITFPPRDLNVSDDTYRPEKEGFEIGFELSASDSIRLKWAYQLGLLEISQRASTNHPGLVVFDEPRQQEAAETSVAGLLAEAARVARRGAQVLIATSEDLTIVERLLGGTEGQLQTFDRRIIGRINNEG